MSFVYRGRGLTILLVVMVLVFGAAVLYRPSLALFNQIKGGHLMQQVVVQEGIDDLSVAFCCLPPLSNANLDQAIASYQKALEFAPAFSHTYLSLGRAYLLKGEPAQAVAAYLNYVRLRPENPLAHLEAGEANVALLRATQNEALGQVFLGSSLQISRDSEVLNLAAQELLAAGTDQTEWVNTAREAFSQKAYERTIYDYQIATILDPTLSAGDRFLWNLAVVLQVPSIEINHLSGVDVIYELSDEIQIAAKDLQWVEPYPFLGQPLSQNPGADPAFGTMWWNGLAVAVVNTSEEGDFQLTLRARDDPPAPIKLSIEHNMVSVLDVSLQQAEAQFVETSVSLKLSPGLHIIGVRFTNDETVNGINRNAVLEWIRLDRK